MTRAALYLRVSLDATGEELAIRRQREDGMRLAAARDWEVVGEYVDNSISASDSRKQRPAYDRLCSDYDAGLFDALICWDLDRLTRQPRQLEDWIDRAERRGLKIITANGEADLTTDGGILYAGIKLQFARNEVRRKGARQTRALRQRAELGKPAKGVRLTGYTDDGKVIADEAKIVVGVFTRFVAGDTLLGIARWLQDAGVPTRRGGQWSPSSVSSILHNGRYAGRSYYKGEDVGKATWPAIINEAHYAATMARLSDPRRKTGFDTARKHIGSGLYLCSCGLRARSSSGMGNGLNRYTCRNTCFYRSARPVDEYVLAVVRGRLAMPDLRELLAQPVDKLELARLAVDRERLRLRIQAFEADYDAGLIDGRRLKVATEKVQAELADIARKETRHLATAGPTSVLGAPDPVAAFDAAPLAIQQRVIDSLATITLHKGLHGSRTFDPDSVTITWRQ